MVCGSPAPTGCVPFELLSVLVDAELARGDLDAARTACAELADRIDGLDLPALLARNAAACARVLAAAGDFDGAAATLEATVDQLDAHRLPWLHATLQLELARLRDRAGDAVAATIDAKAAVALLATLDVALTPTDAAFLEALARTQPGEARAPRTAALAREGKWWVVSCGGASVRLQNTNGLRYLAELLASPGVERHALDLVDRIEGVAPAGGVDRRALGDAGEVLDARARMAYRHRIEGLRSEAEEALALGRLDAAVAVQSEIDQLVAHLAQAFGLRLNVTRALRAAISRLSQAMPGAGEVLDRRVRTGHYCAYEPAAGDEVRWIVQS